MAASKSQAKAVGDMCYGGVGVGVRVGVALLTVFFVFFALFTP